MDGIQLLLKMSEQEGITKRPQVNSKESGIYLWVFCIIERLYNQII